MAVNQLTDAAFAEALQTHEKVVVKYYADWCGSCKLIKPKFKRLSEDERYGSVAFMEINAEENPEARKLANVSNLPTFATFRQGVLVESQPTGKIERVEEMVDQLSV
jgi:thiol-disulfide isomerase/thioredoxin